MTRPINQEAIEKEVRLQETMTAVLAKKYTTSSTTHIFNIPHQILYNQFDKKLPCNKAHETEQLLSHAEEKELLQWITHLTIINYPPRYNILREMAEEIGKWYVKNINEDELELVQYDDIGKKWVVSFLHHYSELTSVHPRPINTVRVKDTSPEWLQWSSNPSTQTRSSISPISTNPFNDAVLTSPPVDFNDIQTTNIALKDMIASGNPISIPAKIYITFLTKNVERLQAVSIIVQHDNEQLKARMYQRKCQLSGKRQVIDGKHIITAAELIGIQKAEKTIWVRKEK
jgi:hypothetical protein